MKRGVVGNVLGCFILHVLTNLYSVCLKLCSWNAIVIRILLCGSALLHFGDIFFDFVRDCLHVLSCLLFGSGVKIRQFSDGQASLCGCSPELT